MKNLLLALLLLSNFAIATTNLSTQVGGDDDVTSSSSGLDTGSYAGSPDLDQGDDFYLQAHNLYGLWSLDCLPVSWPKLDVSASPRRFSSQQQPRAPPLG